MSIFLTVTNVLLAGFVLLCVVLVMRTLIRELSQRRRARSLTVTGLGVTMTDGGQAPVGEGHLSVTQNGKIEKEGGGPPR